MNNPRLKPGWKWVKLGDVASEYSVRVSKPGESGYERFVGSNHIGRFDLTVRDWGSTDEVTSAMKAFQPGDYLFVRRSLYASDFRERAARADFEGLCSGDILTIREKPNVVAGGFLAAVLNDPRIWEYVVARATGSITRRIKWKQLAEYEFALPPLAEQQRMAEALWAAQETVWEIEYALERAKEAENSLFVSFLQGNAAVSDPQLHETVFGLTPTSWPLMTVSEIGEVAYGISAAVSKNTDPSIGWPILTGANITLEGYIDLHKIVYHPEPSKADFILRKGDVLLNWRSGSKEHVGKAALFNLEGDWTYASFILRVRTNHLMNNVFLWRLLNHMRRYQLFGGSTSQQVNFKMNASYFREVEVLTPPKAIQDRIVANLENCWDAQRSLVNRIEAAQSVLKGILDSLGA